MKISLYAIMAAVMLAACSNRLDKDTFDSPVPISFGSDLSLSKTATRSVSGLEEFADSFVVTGYKNGTEGLKDVMTNYKVCYVTNTAGSSVTNTTGWEYAGQGPDQVTKYWDYSATDYRFMGYVPKSADGKINYSSSMNCSGNNIVLSMSGIPRIAILQNGTMKTPNNVTVTDADLPLFSMLWSGAAPQGEPVLLEFVKPYAKLCVEFMRTDNVDAKSITNIKLYKKNGSMPKTGTITVTYPLSGSTYSSAICTATESDTLLFNNVDTSYFKKPNVVYPIYPQFLLLDNRDNESDYVLSCEYGGNRKTSVIPADSLKLENGESYTLLFKLKPSYDPSATKSAIGSATPPSYSLELSISAITIQHPTGSVQCPDKPRYPLVH